MVAKYILFDLDNTLYPRACGLFHLIEGRIKEYLRVRLNLSDGEAAALRRRYLRAYGFTLVGLIKHQGIDPEDYLQFVHEVDVEKILAEDRGLARMMSCIPLKKVIVTNSTEQYAQRVIRRLGVEPFFLHIFDIAFMNYRPKPDPSSFHKVMNHLGAKGDECLMLDDHVPTLTTARTLGMTTVHVGETGDAEADYQIGDIKGLEQVLRALQLYDTRGVEQ
jgi:putative hydrolase of the HAD superfamily